MARSSNLPLPEAQLVSLFLVSVTYGVYLVSAGLCARVLICADDNKRMRHRLMIVAVVLFILTTTDVVINFVGILKVFVLDKGPESAEQRFESLSDFSNVIETANIQLMSLVGDGMLVYRCYVIFSRKLKIILLPALLWLAGGVCGVVIVWLTLIIKTGDIVDPSRLAQMITTFLVITLVTNLLTTGLIVWRIRQVDKESAKFLALPRRQRSRLSKATRIIIESGLLYTIFVLLSLLTEVAGSNAAYGVSQMMLVVIGISFNLIIIRVGQGTAVGGTYDAPTIDAAPNTVIQFADPIHENESHDSKDRMSPTGLFENSDISDKVVTSTESQT